MDACIYSNAHRGNYKIIKEKLLVIEYHQGVGTVDDAKNFRKTQAADFSYSPNYNIITDIRNFAFNVSKQDIWSYAEFLLANPQSVGVRRNAILTQTPNQVAIVTLFQQLEQMLPQTIKVVSTVGAALRWVDTDLSHGEFDSIIKEMKGEMESGK